MTFEQFKHLGNKLNLQISIYYSMLKFSL